MDHGETNADAVTRRRLLGGAALVAAGTGVGCLGRSTTDPAGTSTGTDERERSREETDATGTADEPSRGLPRVSAVSVADFIQYPLAGVHPHVHRRGETQYLVVSVDPSSVTGEPERVRDRLGLVLDGEPTPLATEQPVEWRREPIDVAFAVSKTKTFDAGAVQFEGEMVQSLAASTLDRLNHPPVFSVSDLQVSPSELSVDEQTTATVRFTLSNTGEGPGTFGASVRGNYSSGSATVTATLDVGVEREVSGDVPVIGKGETVAVVVDWGVRQQRLEVPVVGDDAETAATATPAPDEHLPTGKGQYRGQSF